MKILHGYNPILDMFLSFRQLFSNERFRPYNNEMSLMESNLTDKQLKFIDDLGLTTNGYLAAITSLIDLHLDKVSLEEMLIEITNNADILKTKNTDQLLSMWQNLYSFNSVKHGKCTFEKVVELKKMMKLSDPIEVICNISDRVYRDDSRLHFNIKPCFNIPIDEIENIIIMPTIYGTRDLTFWYSGNNLLFFVCLENKVAEDFEPTDMMLLITSALNDKTRLKMLRHMSKNHVTASELANLLNMNASTISRHLKLFKDTGFVDIYSHVGKSITYSVNHSKIDEGLKKVKKYLLVD